MNLGFGVRLIIGCQSRLNAEHIKTQIVWLIILSDVENVDRFVGIDRGMANERKKYFEWSRVSRPGVEEEIDEIAEHL